MATRLLSIDPGLRAAGVALFEDEKLTRCDAVYVNKADGPTQWAAMARALSEWPLSTPDEVAIERMETRPGREDAHDDLIQLSQVSGGVYGLLSKADQLYAPRAGDWTRGRPKHVNHRRVRKRLDDDELAVLDDGLGSVLNSNEKEILDAVGIGLSVLTRWR